jgi:polyisoprenoid-binding protein YceI
MTYRRFIVLLVVNLTVSACGSLITPDIEPRLVELRKGQYTIDPVHSSVHFKVDHFGFSKLVGRFNEFAATLDFDPENPTATKLHAVIRTSSVDFNNTDLEETIRGTRWLNTDAFLEATYTTLSTKQVGDNVLQFTGQLTLLGISRPVDLEVVFNGGANNFLTRRYTLGFAATGILKRSDFGMDSFIPAIGDDIYLDINAEFQRNS